MSLVEAVLFLVLIQEHTNPRQVYLIHDGDSRESLMMLAEIGRDWGKYKLDELESYAKVVRKEVVVIKNLDRLQRGVFYKIGLRGNLVPFDRRAFNDTGRAISTLYVIHWNATVDLRDWKTECEQIEKEAQARHLTEVTNWLSVAAPDRLIYLRSTVPEWGLADNFSWLTACRLYGNYVGFPIYEKPSLTPSPLMLLPWEHLDSVSKR